MGYLNMYKNKILNNCKAESDGIISMRVLLEIVDKVRVIKESRPKE